MRLFEAIHAGCIPVLLSDEIELPFQDIVSWETFSAPRSDPQNHKNPRPSLVDL